jgi:alpha-glucosidase
VAATWWRDAAVYQLYLRSFTDSDGDGIGDLAGLRSRLPYVERLGVDAIWLNPCYTSPQRDHGYDIADYFHPDPAYGDLDDFTAFVEDAHSRGIRVLMDLVANHCSSEHPWFKLALESAPGSPERARFLFRDGRGPDGALPPNNWQSVFGGPAWTRVVESDGAPGQWYLHAFDSSQPDFDWRNAEVAAMFDEVLRHWFGLGVDGFRIDVAHGMVKSEELADWPGADDGTGGHNFAMWDQAEVHDIYRRWRAIGDRYDPPRYFVGEVWVPTTDALRAYLAPDELHQVFTFDLLIQPWDADGMRRAIEGALDDAEIAGTDPAWTLSNHDVHRTVTRYGQEQDLTPPDATDMIAAARRVGPVDLALGGRRARAGIMLQLALPGAAYLYQGEELGLPEVFDVPDEARQDPIWVRSGGQQLGRDGCRVPLPWSAGEPAFGFGPPDSRAPWLPQPDWFADFAVDQQEDDPASTLRLYRNLLAQRRQTFGTGAPLRWLDAGEQVLAFARGTGLCIVNFGSAPFTLPAEWTGELVAVSEASDDQRVVAPDRAAWYVLDREPAVEQLTPQLHSTPARETTGRRAIITP